jgi:integrase
MASPNGRIQITDRFLRSLKPPPPGKRSEIVDQVQPGLRLRVSETGVKTWSIQRRVNGRKRRFTLGTYPALSLSEARARAGKLLVKVQDGYDPIAERRTARVTAALPAAVTLSEAIGLYTKAVLSSRRRGTEVERSLRRDLADLLETPAAGITVSDLATIIDRKASSAPIMANRLVAALKPFWRWMANRGHCPHDTVIRLEKPARERARDRVLSAQELGAVWKACDDVGTLWSAFFKLLILTAQRREEVAAMRWSEIDLPNRTWRIPAERTKTGRPHTVHLSGPTLEVLASIRSNGGELVFSTTGVTPVSGFSKAKARLDVLSGVSNWRIHDLRRTAVTAMADLGVDATVADRILNHVGAGTMGTVKRVYQRSELLDQRKDALERWSEYLVQACPAGQQ